MSIRSVLHTGVISQSFVFSEFWLCLYKRFKIKAELGQFSRFVAESVCIYWMEVKMDHSPWLGQSLYCRLDHCQMWPQVYNMCSVQSKPILNSWQKLVQKHQHQPVEAVVYMFCLFLQVGLWDVCCHSGPRKETVKDTGGCRPWYGTQGRGQVCKSPPHVQLLQHLFFLK